MATSPLGGFADLSGYRRQLDAQKAAQIASDPLADLILSAQQGYALQQLPNTLMAQQAAAQDAALARELNNALVQEKLNVLRNPEAARNAKLQEALVESLASGRNPALVSVTGTAPADFQELVPATAGRPAIGLSPSSRTAAEQAELEREIKKAQALHPATTTPLTKEVNPGQVVIERQPDGSYKEVFKATPKPASAGAAQFVRNIQDPTDIRLVPTDETGRPPEGYEFLKTAAHEMKPSEIISSKKEIRATYDDLPSKVDFFGKGQVPGSYQLKNRLDAVLKPVGGDFSKLNPQAANTFVFALNKLRDPTSATLLSEASQIAGRAGIADRFDAYIQNIKTGNQISPQVAKDIYDVITQVHDVHRENLINELLPLKDDTDAIGVKLTSLGVPKEIQDEVERRIAGASAPAPQAVPQGSVKSGNTFKIVR